jgi:hypothetical protein
MKRQVKNLATMAFAARVFGPTGASAEKMMILPSTGYASVVSVSPARCR